MESGSRIGFVQSLKGKLLLFFLIVGILPAAIVGLLSYNKASSSLETEAFAKLESVGGIKTTQVQNFFAERKGDMGVLVETVNVIRQEAFFKLDAIRTLKKAQIEQYFGMVETNLGTMKDNPTTINAIVAFKEAFQADGGKTGGARWSAVEDQYGPVFTDVMEDTGYYDVFLIAEDGNVIFTAAKESDLGENLRTGQLRDSGLAEAFQGAMSSAMGSADFSPYAPSGNLPAAFMSMPVRASDGTLLGVVAIQVPDDQINTIMQERTGMGRTGETYLVGSDKLMRSDSFLDPVGHSMAASFAGNVANNGVDTEAAAEALAGRTDSDVIIDYNGNSVLSSWAPIDILGTRWGIIAEIDLAEAFAPQVVGQSQDFFTKYKEQYGYYDLFLITPDGYVFYTVEQEADYLTNMLTGKYASSNMGTLTRDILASQGYEIVDFEPYAPSNGAPAAFIGQPVVHEGGVELIVALQLPLDAINGIMQERTGMGATGETYLVGPDKLMRSDSYLDPVGHSVLASLQGTVDQNGVDTDATLNGLAGQTGSEIITDYNGNPVLSVYAPANLEGLNWVIIAEIDEAEAMAPAKSMLTMFLLVLGVSAVAVVVVAYLIAMMIANPLVAMVPVAAAVAQGDLDQKMDVKSKDEVGAVGAAFTNVIGYMQEMAGAADKIADGDLTVDVTPKSEKDVLGNAFSRMIANLRDVIGQVGSTAGSVSEASAQLSTAAEQAGQATQGIASTSQQVAKGAEEQTQSVQETTKGMQQLSAAIEQIAKGSQQQASSVEQAATIVNQVSSASSDVAKNAQAAAEGAKEATEAANNGRDMVAKTVEGMNKVKSAVDTASGKISELGAQSAEIGNIVAVIDDIAAQTNLLALNAAIEAARAGEQGRGFAVVADEVRKLAERVTSATKEIATLIEGVQKGVTESISATEEGAKEVEEGARLAEEAGKALDQIRDSVISVTEQIEQISAAAEEVSASSDEMVKTIDGVSSVVEQNSAATQEMAANSTQVDQSVESIANITQQNSAASQEVSATAEEMSAQVEEVVASSQSLDGMAKELQVAVSRFKLNGNGAASRQEKAVQS
ncbi:MAG: methyl-accepting chemotaxis protein [Dehalococcoidia bacterium]